jgi:single-strand DNA-binding protein
MLNKVMLIGNICSEPNVRKTGPTQLTVADFRVAVDAYGKHDTAVTEYFRVVAFGRNADAVQQFARLGATVYVEGQLRTRSYEKNGEKKYMTEVVASVFRIVRSSKKTMAPEKTEWEKPFSNDEKGPYESDEEIPF